MPSPPSSPSGAPSSAGWNTNTTVPGRRDRTDASTSATRSEGSTWLGSRRRKKRSILGASQRSVSSSGKPGEVGMP
mgnify:CR=1 FL=1